MPTFKRFRASTLTRNILSMRRRAGGISSASAARRIQDLCQRRELRKTPTMQREESGPRYLRNATAGRLGTWGLVTTLIKHSCRGQK